MTWQSESPASQVSDREILTMWSEPRGAARIPVRSRGCVIYVKPGDIDWVEAATDCVRLHTRDATHVHRHTMRQMTSALDPARFLRVHRSAIINVERVVQLRIPAAGPCYVILEDGAHVRVGRIYREQLERRLAGALGSA